MKQKFWIYGIATVAVILLVISCPGCKGIQSGLNKITDAITNPSAREVYAREFDDSNPGYHNWDLAFDRAKADSLLINLPYGEKGSFTPNENLVYSYTITMQEGEVLIAVVEKDSVNQRVFIDVFKKQDSVFNHLESAAIQENRLALQIKSSGEYKVIIQPEVMANAGFFIKLNKQPLFSFPVAGKGNSAIGSFWGMERDGGKRRHEGIDIFAAKGTPVVAAIDGVIGYTGEKGLGGRQVWLRTGLFSSSLYYAHLDSIVVQTGERVNTGDTLGFVGNTGNARFTPPHLHFGIYKHGAVNPLPYVYETEDITAQNFAESFKSSLLKAKSKANLRQGPSVKNEVIGALSANDTITLLGQHNDWVHIQTTAGQKAFLHKSLAQKIR